MITNQCLLAWLNEVLQPGQFNDYCPNGLQVEGKRDIRKVVTGVTASQGLIDRAIAVGADAIIVHHGYFWKGESQVITGIKRSRLKALLQHDINLYGYHLPLDAHHQLGNNVQLANRLNINIEGGLQQGRSPSVVMHGHFTTPITVAALTQRVTDVLSKTPLVEGSPDRLIKTVGWCTGGGQGFIELAVENQLDAFITGEVSEQTIHIARETDTVFFAAGHHATERYGVKALGEYLATKLDVDVQFIDVDNPA